MLLYEDIYKNYSIDLEDKFKILTYPDPILLKKSTPVINFNTDLIPLIKKMLNTMYDARGIGLAAPQVGLNQRLIVLDVDYEISEKQDVNQNIIKYQTNLNPKVFINPEIVEQDGNIKYQEGCLSLPTIYEDVQRSQTIKIKYNDLDGSVHFLEAQDLLAICIQHEIDHLNGIVFIDRISSLKKSISKKKLLKLKKDEKI